MSGGANKAVFREWSPYGGPAAAQKSVPSNKTNDNKVVFKGWSPQKSSDEKLDQEADKLRKQLYELRENGRQKRLRQLESRIVRIRPGIHETGQAVEAIR